VWREHCIPGRRRESTVAGGPPSLQRLDPGREVGQLDRLQRDATSDTVVRARSAVPSSQSASAASSCPSITAEHVQRAREPDIGGEERREVPRGRATLTLLNSVSKNPAAAPCSAANEAVGPGGPRPIAPIGRGALRLPRAAEDQLASVVGERLWRLVPWEHAVGDEFGS
jgi:hypothetical protein